MSDEKKFVPQPYVKIRGVLFNIAASTKLKQEEFNKGHEKVFGKVNLEDAWNQIQKALVENKYKRAPKPPKDTADKE